MSPGVKGAHCGRKPSAFTDATESGVEVLDVAPEKCCSQGEKVKQIVKQKECEKMPKDDYRRPARP